MNKFFLALLALPMVAQAVMPANGAYELDRSGHLARKYSLGSNLQEAQTFGLKGVWSYEVDGGAVGSYNLKNKYLSEAVVLPSGAIITNCFFEEVTPITSAGSTAKLSLDSETTGDLKAAVAATSVSGKVACIPDGTVSNMVKLTAQRNLKLSISSEAATAGKVNVFIQYVLSE